TGVQACALPICEEWSKKQNNRNGWFSFLKKPACNLKWQTLFCKPNIQHRQNNRIKFLKYIPDRTLPLKMFYRLMVTKTLFQKITLTTKLLSRQKQRKNMQET